MTVLEKIPNLDVTPEQIAAFCRKWDIHELALFGSVLRDDFTPESDVDVLFVPGPAVRVTLDYLVKAETELGALIGHRVDLIDKQQIARDPNYIRRRIILGSAQVVYAAG